MRRGAARHTAAALTAVLMAAGAPAEAAALAAELLRNQIGVQPGSQTSGQTDALAAALEQLLVADYLNDDERRALRIFHGRHADADLRTNADRAFVALTAHRWDDPVFDEQDTPGLDRAEAAWRRGDNAGAVDLLGDDESLRACWIRAEALFDLGRYEDIEGAVAPVVRTLASERADAINLVHGVRALTVRARVAGSAQNRGGDYRTLLSLLARARAELDRFDWRVRLAEAELLYEKHNLADAMAAAQEVLVLNPRCADAHLLLGRLAVGGFRFDAVESAAATLNHLDRLDAPPGGDGDNAEPAGMSAGAAAILARAAMRQRLATHAGEIIERARERWPAHVELHALEAAAAAVGHDDRRAQTVLDEISRGGDPNARAVEIVGSALSDARQYGAAAARLRQAHERLPNWSDPLIALGLLGLQSGDEAGAIDALEKAVALDPFNARATNSLTLARDLAAYRTIETPHFAIRHAPGMDAVLARDMAVVLERIHERVAGAGPYGVDHEPGERTIVEIMPTHARFAVRITGNPDIWTNAASTGPVIALETPREGRGLKAGAYHWARVVQHEYAHTVTLSRSANRIPHWMTEAWAVLLEDSPRDAGTWLLLHNAWRSGELFDAREINIAFVRPAKPHHRSLAYAQGAWLLEYAFERFGDAAPRELLDRLAAGEQTDDAFRGAFGISQDELFDDFMAWAEGDLRANGLLAPEGEPTLDELLDQEGLERPTPEAVASWAERYPDHPAVLELSIALALSSNGGEPAPEMVPMLEHASALRPSDPTPRRLLVRLQLTSGDPADRARAIEHLEALDAVELTTPAYAAQLARMYAEAGQADLAHAKGERATQLAPFDPTQRELAAQMALLARAMDDAERHLMALAELEPHVQKHLDRLEALRRLREGE